MHKKSKGQSFLQGAFIMMAASLVVKVIGAFFQIPLQNLIGGEKSPAFGMFSAAYRIYTAVLVISTVGLPASLSKMVAEATACGREHEVSCPTHAFVRERALAFSCAASGLDCCYVGEEGPVFAALQRLEEAVDKLEAASGEKGAFLDELVMQEVLSELKEIAQRDGISCTCGSHRWKLQVNFSSIDLFCADCGGAMRIPAATASDIDDICCKNKLVIHGQD